MITLIVICTLILLLVARILLINPRTNSFIGFMITKGHHYSYIEKDPLKLRYIISPFFGNRITFETVFGIGCKYDDMSMGMDRFDINKLYGLQFAITNQKGSARIGWRWDSESHKILLFGYVHTYNSIAKFAYVALGSVQVGQQFRSTISVLKDKTIYFLVDKISKDQTVTRINAQIPMLSSQPVWRLKFRQWPYFGGNKVAPQSMRIFIKEV